MNTLNKRQFCQKISLILLGASTSKGLFAKTPIGNPRIVSIGGANTEIIHELGLHPYLVGIDTSSNYPQSITHLPNVGYARALSLEGVLSLRPTHVLSTDMAGPAHVLESIKKYKGVQLERVNATSSFEGLIQHVQFIANLFGKSNSGYQLSRRLQQEMNAVEELNAFKKLKPLQVDQDLLSKAGLPRVLFILSHQSSQVVAGGLNTAAHAMIEYAGGKNVMDQVRGYKTLNKEAFIQINPDILLMTSQSEKFLRSPRSLLRDPSMVQISAIKNNRIVVMDANQLLGFGPRLPLTIGQLRKSFFA
jgi:iron complex transport system substrate-binding protein